MDKKQKIMVTALATLALAGIGTTVYFSTQKPNKPAKTHKVSEIKQPSSRANVKKSDASSNTKSDTSSSKLSGNAESSAQNTAPSSPTSTQPKALTQDEVSQIVERYYLTRSRDMNIEESKKKLREVIADDTIYNTMASTLDEYVKNIKQAIETKNFDTWNKDNPNNYPYTLTEDNVLSDDHLKTEAGSTVTSTFVYLSQTVPDGYNNTYKGYIKVSYIFNKENKITSFSESEFIDERRVKKPNS